MWTNDRRKTKMSYLPTESYLERIFYIPYKFLMLNDFGAILGRVEYFSFLPKCNVFTLTCSTLFSFTHFRCTSIWRVSKNIKFRGDGMFGASDMWLMIWKYEKMFMGQPFELEYSSFQCYIVIYIHFMRWSIFFFFAYLLRLSFGVKTVTSTNAIPTQFSVKCMMRGWRLIGIRKRRFVV